MKKLLMSLPVVAALVSGCDPSTTPVQPAAGKPDDSTTPTRPSIPTQLAVQWQPTDNSVGSWKFFRSTLTLQNQGPGELGATGWKLYFSFVRRILSDREGDITAKQDLVGQGIKISRADLAGSGDYYVLEPLPTFKPLASGQQRALDILASDWAILKTDAPSGFHIAFSGGALHDDMAYAVTSTVKLEASDARQTTRFEGDMMPVQTPGLRFSENSTRMALELKDRLLPVPRQVTAGTGEVKLGSTAIIGYGPEVKGEAAYLTAALKDLMTVAPTARAATGGEQVTLRVNSALDINGDGAPDAEGYTLDVKDGKVTLVGGGTAGVFYGIQTLRQLVPTDAYAAAVKPEGRLAELSLPAVSIADMPGFTYRGMALDVARHFQSKETVKRLLDVLSSYKINKFHFHVTDDEGWRLEIPGIPELTSYGARRGFDLAESEMLHTALGSGNDLDAGDRIDLKPARRTVGTVKQAFQGFDSETVNFVGKGNGYYTTHDFEEILAYATERHIDVIPEVDVPGHARAAVKSMEYRYNKLKSSDPAGAAAYRLVDPADTSTHQSVQSYTDNFVNPCLDSTYAFLDKVAKEIKARYDAVPGAKLTAIHAGGDELPPNKTNVWWQGSPLCKSNSATKELTDVDLYNRFFKRWNDIIRSTGAATTGWDDILHQGQDLKDFMPMPWSNVWDWGREDDAYKFANQGYRVILSSATNLYMDLAYNKDPDEPGYYWANFVDDKKTFEYRPFDIFVNGTESRMGVPFPAGYWDKKEHLTAEGKKNILGMHGLLWGENNKSPEVLEYMAFPKILGVAERAWNPELPAVTEMPALWARFTNSLGQYVLPRLDAYRAVDLRGELPASVGVNYRVPPPGAQVSKGTLSANVRYPGLALEYSTDGGSTWQAYSAPVAVTGKALVRTRASDGRVSRVSEVN